MLGDSTMCNPSSRDNALFRPPCKTNHFYKDKKCLPQFILFISVKGHHDQGLEKKVFDWGLPISEGEPDYHGGKLIAGAGAVAESFTLSLQAERDIGPGLGF